MNTYGVSRLPQHPGHLLLNRPLDALYPGPFGLRGVCDDQMADTLTLRDTDGITATVTVLGKLKGGDLIVINPDEHAA